MNYGTAIFPTAPAGAIHDPRPTRGIFAALAQPCLGTIEVFGCVDSNGSPVPWLIEPGTSGIVAAPGNSGGNALNFVMSVPADAAATCFVYRNV